jgi:hypothetical protein
MFFIITAAVLIIAYVLILYCFFNPSLRVPSLRVPSLRVPSISMNSIAKRWIEHSEQREMRVAEEEIERKKKEWDDYEQKQQRRQQAADRLNQLEIEQIESWRIRKIQDRQKIMTMQKNAMDVWERDLLRAQGLLKEDEHTVAPVLERYEKETIGKDNFEKYFDGSINRMLYNEGVISGNEFNHREHLRLNEKLRLEMKHVERERAGIYDEDYLHRMIATITKRQPTTAKELEARWSTDDKIFKTQYQRMIDRQQKEEERRQELVGPLYIMRNSLSKGFRNEEERQRILRFNEDVDATAKKRLEGKISEETAIKLIQRSAKGHGLD